MARRSAADILGPAPAAKKEAEESNQTNSTEWAHIRKGVSVTWLSGALGMDRKTVQRRLVTCPPKKVDHNGNKTYDFKEAISYLVTPNFDIGEYVRTMNVTELPAMVRKEYWMGEQAKQKVMLAAGELWHTSDVLNVLAEAFGRAKGVLQVWPDTLEREVGATRDQYKAMIKAVNKLRDDLYQSLVEMPKHAETKNMLREYGDVEIADDDSA